MRLRKRKPEYGCEINIAPLIDVVFLLIIFFLTVSHITQLQVEPLSLPEAEEGPEEAPAAEVVERRRFRENPSVAIAFASTLAAVLMVTSVAIWAPFELGFVVPWMLGSLTALGIGLGVTATIGCRRRQ